MPSHQSRRPVHSCIVSSERASFRAEVARTLASQGFCVSSTNSHDATWGEMQIRSFYVDVIVLDVGKVGMTSLELHRMLRRHGFGGPMVVLCPAGTVAGKDFDEPRGSTMLLPEAATSQDISSALERLFALDDTSASLPIPV